MKKQIRNYFKEERKSLKNDEATHLGNLAQEIFLSSDLYQKANNIMVYMPLGNETGTEKIILGCLNDNKTVLLPVTDIDTNEITPVVYTKNTELYTGAYSITEPKNSPAFDKNQIDLVIVPGIAFSQKGGRIGFGKGCYDRLLKDMTAKKVGFCYDFQLSNLIKCEEHDVKMDYIITDKKIYNCKECNSHIPANYHTHTYLSHHAVGTPKEYIEKAIENGIEVLGFSDHTPCPFSNGHKSNFRIDLEDTKAYIDMILSLKEEYRYKIKILLGYEAEYYPDEFDKTMEYLNQFPYDYLILGQHFTKNEYDGNYSGSYACTKDDLIDYVNQVIEGINKGAYSYIAHPDLIYYRDNQELYKSEMTRLLKEAKRLKIPVEFNLLGFEEGRSYPYDEFWKLVKKVGNSVIIGCDAHKTEACGNPEIYLSAKEKLSEYGIEPIEFIELKRGKL